jgi:hypothetical protein
LFWGSHLGIFINGDGGMVMMIMAMVTEENNANCGKYYG